MSILSLIAALCPLAISAQDTHKQVIPIDQLFRLADQHSKTLRPAASGIQEAQAAIRQAQQARLPEIDVALSFSYLGDGYLSDRNFSNSMKAPIPHYGNNFSLEVTQTLYSGGAIPSAIAIAKMQETGARLQLETERNDVRFLLAGYYLDLFKQQNLLQVYEKHIQQTRQVLQDLQSKARQGIVLKNDITRYELLLSNTELSRTQIQNSLSILNTYLLAALGLPEDVQIQPDTMLLSQSLPLDGDGHWRTLAVAQSPALQQQQLSVQIHAQQDRIIRSELLPQVALVAANHLEGPITFEVPPINKNFNYWYIGLGVKYRLSSVYKTKQSIRKSQYTIQRSAEQYDAAREQTELSIQAAYIRYLEAYEQLHTQQKSVELSHQHYSLVSNRYQNDMALLTDMLDASNAKLSAELQLVNAQVEIVFDYIKLLYHSGTLINL